MLRVVAMDCEMVGSGKRSILARVTIVDELGDVVIDEYVRPTAPVTDYRTPYSGITKQDLENGSNFFAVRKKVSKLIHGCILVGHSLQYDLGALKLQSHPKRLRRDLAKYQPFLKNNGGKPVALKTLAKKYLEGRDIQNGKHDSVEDAIASLDLYRKFPNNW